MLEVPAYKNIGSDHHGKGNVWSIRAHAPRNDPAFNVGGGKLLRLGRNRDELDVRVRNTCHGTPDCHGSILRFAEREFG